MIEKHIKKTLPIINSLIYSNRCNVVVLSILSTEMFFRNKANRLLEIFGWLILSKLSSSRMRLISIGIAQVQIRNWVELGFFKSEKPSLENIIMAFNKKTNYDICLAFLKKNNWDEEFLPLKDISKIYTGGFNQYYFKIFTKHFEYYKKLTS